MSCRAASASASPSHGRSIAEPSLLLCDEILSALDVSVQASILALLQRLKAERGIAMLFISHDLAVVRMLADRVCVLFRGDIMEIGRRDQIFAAPFHPYTHSLLEAVPTPLQSRPHRGRHPRRREGAVGRRLRLCRPLRLADRRDLRARAPALGAKRRTACASAATIR